MTATFASEFFKVKAELGKNVSVFVFGDGLPIAPQPYVQGIGGRIEQEDADRLQAVARQIGEQERVLSRFGSEVAEAKCARRHHVSGV